ncbi:MAG: hypothetical protein ACRDV3_01055 [Acidothermaceae bacterium]
MSHVAGVLVRAARLLASLALATGAVVMLPAAVGTASAATPTIACDKVSHTSTDWATCQQVVATASCYWDNRDGSYTIALGYVNSSDAVLTAAAGTDYNGIVIQGSPATFDNPGRLTAFEPGTSQTAFTMTTRASNTLADWWVMQREFAFTTSNTPKCASKPVPMMGNSTAVALTFGLFVGLLAVVNRRRLTRLARSPWLHRAT